MSSAWFETIKKLLVSLSIILFVYEVSAPTNQQPQQQVQKPSSPSLRSGSPDITTVDTDDLLTDGTSSSGDLPDTSATTVAPEIDESQITPDNAATLAIQAEIAKRNVKDQEGAGTPYFPHKNLNLGQRTDPNHNFVTHFHGNPQPKIAWLMSFPNSGTSYTMTTVEIMSNLSTASNYGDEVTHKTDFSIPVHPLHTEGPFWEGLSGKMGRIRQLPENYVLVKTHCGSRCIHCAPHQYIENLTSFGDACRNTTARIPPKRKRQLNFYPLERVHKAIHVIRNPYHNFIARFHLDIRNTDSKGRETPPNSPEGFREWCAHLDTAYLKEEHELFEYEMAKQVRLSPCHGEVFKYIQWHNLAFQLVESMGIESHLVYYENYTHHAQESMEEMLDFLELPTAVSEPREFKAKDYDQDEYYSHLDRRRMRLLAERIASPKTWEAVKHYFPKFKRDYEATTTMEEEGKEE